jgi:transcriptional regulator with XRE-family HTH domain
MSAPVQVGPSPQGGGPVPSPDWDEVLADIGDRIRAERQARGWSQSRLGARAGLSLATIKRLEEGNGTLRVFALSCHALGVTMAHVMSCDWQMPARHALLTVRQAEVLGAVATGRTLSQAARELGVPREGLAARLSKIYVQMGLGHLPKDQRRAAAVRMAAAADLIDAA